MTKRTFLTIILLVVCSLNVQAAEKPRPPYTIVAFGDSLTESVQVAKDLRWQCLLENMLREKHPEFPVRVVNAGVGGHTSREGLERMERDVLKHRPNLVIVAFGANDETNDPARHVTLDEYAKNLRAMHDGIVRRAGAKMICWPSTPFLNAQHCWGKLPFFAAAGGPDEYQIAYRKRMVQVCKELGDSFVDMDAIFRDNFQKKGEKVFILPDGIHFREAGNRLIAESLLPEIEKIIFNEVK